MYRILVYGMTENRGGIEQVIINFYKNMPSNKIHFDFLIDSGNKIAFSDSLQKDSKVFYIPSRSKHPLNYIKTVKNFFKKNAKNYDCFWVNKNDLANIDYLQYAKKCGIPRIILHSHNTRVLDSGMKAKLKIQLHNWHKKKLSKFVTDYWACSMDAAKWFYPDDILNKVVIVKNAIDMDKTAFNIKKREKIRQQYNLNNYFIVGNVGRLDYQKNQLFALKVLKELVKQKQNVKMVFVGTGKDEAFLKSEAKKMNLSEKVIFAGMQNDMQAWYSSFDCFIFPSLFEGLGVAAIEAQANGMWVIAAKDNVPMDAKINDNFIFFDLKLGPKIWAEKILSFDNKLFRVPENIIKRNFDNTGYNLNLEKDKVLNLFLKASGSSNNE